MKRCTKCGVSRPLLMFYKDVGGADGLRSQCKICEAKRNKEWHASNRERHIAAVNEWRAAHRAEYLAYQSNYNADEDRKRRDRAGHLKRKYGMTIEDYDGMLEAQGGGCAICGRPPRPDISLHVDHDHETGRIRGILCWPCNNLLGDVQDDPARLYAAADYLTREPDVEALIRGRVKVLALAAPEG